MNLKSAKITLCIFTMIEVLKAKNVEETKSPGRKSWIV